MTSNDRQYRKKESDVQRPSNFTISGGTRPKRQSSSTVNAESMSTDGWGNQPQLEQGPLSSTSSEKSILRGLMGAPEKKPKGLSCCVRLSRRDSLMFGGIEGPM
ncbi:hypothetical protein H2248_001635 [Termitomyces sp. 'cryptogamus']|nr:hypothetical protein H2248_001635 [Termitomyces sp. 'cryptogamus']